MKSENIKEGMLVKFVRPGTIDPITSYVLGFHPKEWLNNKQVKLTNNDIGVIISYPCMEFSDAVDNTIELYENTWGIDLKLWAIVLVNNSLYSVSINEMEPYFENECFKTN